MEVASSPFQGSIPFASCTVLRLCQYGHKTFSTLTLKGEGRKRGLAVLFELFSVIAVPEIMS